MKSASDAQADLNSSSGTAYDVNIQRLGERDRNDDRTYEYAGSNGEARPFQKLTVRPARGSVPPCRVVTAAERRQLIAWSRTRTSPHRLVVRSRIILLAADGLSVAAIAKRLNLGAATVRLWCARFQLRGIGALEHEDAGRGRPRGMSLLTIMAVLRTMATLTTDQPWTARRLATIAGTSASTVSRICNRYQLGPDVSRAQVHRALREVIHETAARRGASA